MSDQFKVPTVRVADGKGFVLVNCEDFDHDVHELFDKKDAHLVPKRSKKVTAAEEADIEELKKLLGDAEDRAVEAESERDEWKARAEQADASLSDDGKKKK